MNKKLLAEKRGKVPTLINYLYGLIARLEELGRFRAAESLRSTCNSLQRFKIDAEMPLNRVNRVVIEDYEAWLKSSGVCRNTSSFYLRNLRSAFQKAEREGLMGSSCEMFATVYTGIDKTVKRAIGRSEISRLRELDLAGERGLSLARDIFMFSFFARGMPFIDMAYLRKRDVAGGRIIYHRRKTGQCINVEWIPEIAEIVRRNPTETSFLLPIINRENGRELQQYKTQLRLYNLNLKKLGQMAGILVPLTSYVSRHSWATIARDSGVPISVIGDGLGHEDLKTTMIYLTSISTSKVDEANRHIASLI